MDRLKLAEEIVAQQVWITRCGTTLDGYREVYKNAKLFAGLDPDDIYAADIGFLQELNDQYYLGISRDEAKQRRVLGDGYFD